ncbi:HEPN domain-containing protein [Brevundimonas sp.]|jgi:uncharacterized protein (UPF0332 family)|uniref:HEPN domain-containing protein n=1 Tax=Brevundimonas sp. TaxID=1871086 RepID=UPI002E0E57A1|nr:HEPN domain-containing protein [Brevundimonas sp.]
MARERHPPKKKHQNRPRPLPVVPLTDTQRRARAIEEMVKAETLLAEAEKLAVWGEAPLACVHSAYYAMHHAAVAALFATGGVGRVGDVPKSHEHVIQHFGNLVEGLGDEALRASGVALSRARTDRVAADYDMDVGFTSAEAADLVASARALVEAVKATWPSVSAAARAP